MLVTNTIYGSYQYLQYNEIEPRNGRPVTDSRCLETVKLYELLTGFQRRPLPTFGSHKDISSARKYAHDCSHSLTFQSMSSLAQRLHPSAFSLAFASMGYLGHGLARKALSRCRRYCFRVK